MAKRYKNSKNSSLLLIAASAAFLLALFVVNNKDLNFNLNSSAGRNRYRASGTLVLSSDNSSCDSSYQYGLVDSSAKKGCTPVVGSSSVVGKHIGKNVDLEGAFKGNVFYINSLSTKDPDVIINTSLPRPQKTPSIPPSRY